MKHRKFIPGDRVRTTKVWGSRRVGVVIRYGGLNNRYVMVHRTDLDEPQMELWPFLERNLVRTHKA